MLHHKMRKRRPVATTGAKEMRGGGPLLLPGGATRSSLQACGGCAHQKPQDERVHTDSRLCNRWKSQFKQHWSSFLSLTSWRQRPCRDDRHEKSDKPNRNLVFWCPAVVWGSVLKRISAFALTFSQRRNATVCLTTLFQIRDVWSASFKSSAWDPFRKEKK